MSVTFFSSFTTTTSLSGRDPIVAPTACRAARYLRQRLTSIKAQTCPIFEVIVLDDASTDDSLAVLDALAREMQELRVVWRATILCTSRMWTRTSGVPTIDARAKLKLLFRRTVLAGCSKGISGRAVQFPQRR